MPVSSQVWRYWNEASWPSDVFIMWNCCSSWWQPTISSSDLTLSQLSFMWLQVTHWCFHWLIEPQDWPEAGPLVRSGDKLWPLEGAFLPGRPQDSSHEVYEPDHAGGEYWWRSRLCCASLVIFFLFFFFLRFELSLFHNTPDQSLSFTELYNEYTVRCALNQTSAKQGEPSIYTLEANDIKCMHPVIMFDCLPLWSFQLTTYTTLMQVSEGKLESYIRDCPNPCMPWWSF